MLGNIGISEFVLIALAALLLFGPERMPEVGRKVGRFVREARTMAGTFMVELTRDPEQRRADNAAARKPAPTTAPADMAAAQPEAEHDAGLFGADFLAELNSAAHDTGGASLSSERASVAASLRAEASSVLTPLSERTPTASSSEHSAAASPTGLSSSDDPSEHGEAAASPPERTRRRPADPRRLPE
ncbi:twin-arginine translocase TatA/TatE family subunit [Paenibacillus chartarius]|uniref:Twin-arginine translocase TatA/TatE family subunit n=1 Tax=Paenibacillus chartarius TaxID=747481 RepID=A0ABV6DKU3_9BACL